MMSDARCNALGALAGVRSGRLDNVVRPNHYRGKPYEERNAASVFLKTIA